MRIVKEAVGLKNRGHRIFLGVIENGLLIEKAKQAGLVVFSLKLRKKQSLTALLQIMQLIKKYKIDLVVTHSSIDSWLGGLAARFLKKKIVRLRHLSTPIRGGLNGFLLYKKLCDFVVTTSDIARQEVIKKAAQDPAKCLEVATGINPDFALLQEEKVLSFRKSLSIKKTDFLVGTACFMRSWKGIDDFLKTAWLLQEKENVKFVIIGGGHMQSYVDKAKKMHLKNLFFTGHLPDPSFALAALDVFALLSTAHEGVSQSLLQAAFLKKPLIGTPAGGIPEICQDRITGLQVPLFCAEKVKDAILILQKNRNMAKEMGEKAFFLVKNYFTEKQMLDQMETVYQKVLL